MAHRFGHVWRVVAVSAFWLCSAHLGYAGEPARWASLAEPVFQSLGVAAGLPNPVALALTEDTEGFLWIGTGSGLARWDGYRFHVYGGSAQKSDALPDTYVQALHRGRDGTLWVGTSAGGLARYDSKRDSFVRIPLGDKTSGRMEIRALADDDGTGVWVGGGGGLFHVDATNGVSRIAPHGPSDSRALPSGKVTSLLHDHGGNLWVGTEHGLFLQPKGASDFTRVALVTGISGPGMISALAEDSAGRIWAGTKNSGAFVIGAADRVARQIRDAAGSAESAETLDIESMSEMKPGEMWLGSLGHGIVTVDTKTWQTRHMRHDPARPTSLADDTISAIFKDHADRLWIATSDGVNQIAPRQDAIRTVFSKSGAANSISDPNLYTVMAAPDGRIWLGFAHDGVSIVDPAAGSIAPAPGNAALPAAIVNDFATLPGQGVFIATRRGLFHAVDDGQNVTPVPLPGARQSGEITAMATIGNAIWLTDSEHLYRLQHGAPEAVIPTSALTDKRARTMLPDGQGRIWIGTWDGLNRFDPASGRVDQARTDPVDPNSLSTGLIACLALDRQGRLWVGTAGGGIDILTGRTPAGRMVFRHLDVEDGLPNPNIDKLLMAPDGHMWASTDDGLAEIDPDSLQVRAFHLADGVAIPAYWADSGAVTKAGELLFGGTGGLTIVRPHAMMASVHHLRLAITDLRVGNAEIPAAAFNVDGADAAHATPRLAISPDSNALAVEFSALDYADPEHDLYSYQMIGMDEHWIETDPTRRVAAYTNLPPGKFTLRLRAIDSSGDHTAAEFFLPIKVLPAWYQTLWAKAAFIAAAVLAMMGVLRASTNLLRRRQRELEQVIDRRTGELSRSNTALTLAAETLRTLSTVGQQITASLDLETVLTVLHQSVSSLIDAPYFAVYLAEGSERIPALQFGISNGTRMAPGMVHPELGAIVQRVVAEQKEIVLPEAPDLRSPPSNMDGGDVISLICAPLVVLGRVIGAILIQSSKAYAYQDRERLIFRTLCDYGAIALSNAETIVTLADVRSRLEHIAYSDGLTNLPNRRVFINQFGLFAARHAEHGEQFALLLIDLDGFKTINDTYGHDTGDALLVQTADRLRTIVRGTDVVIRLGGDEFAILLSGVDGPAKIEDVCRRVATSFAIGLRVRNAVVETNASIGIAIFPNDGDSQDKLYKAADLALYAVKRRGGGSSVFFEPALHDAALSDMQIRHDLVRALECGELSVHYQPLFTAPDRRLCGFEALMRWHHPERGWIPPAEFIRNAEESGLIPRLGRFVLIEAVAWAKRWRRFGDNLTIAVNLSVRHLAEGSVSEFLGGLLAKTELDPAAICIEVTESALMNESARSELHRLQHLGVTISIDDFGTGYSSLAYLSALPVDTVKIDKSFVARLGSDAKAERFFRAVVDLAHTLDLRTIAEGCETEAQWNVIAASGCNAVQGWLLAKAMDPAGIEAFIESMTGRVAPTVPEWPARGFPRLAYDGAAV